MNLYNRTYWLCFIIYTLCATAFSLSFKFGLFLQGLGASYFTVGLIVSLGVVAGLLAKIKSPYWVLRYGVRSIWSASHLAMVAGFLLFIFSQHLGLDVVIGRVLLVSGYAISTVIAMSLAQAVVPRAKVTSGLTFFGSSLFLGMLIASIIFDYSYFLTKSYHTYLFIVGASFAGLASLLCFLIPFGIMHPANTYTRINWNQIKSIIGHWSVWGAMLLGAVYSIPQMFLALYADQYGFSTMAWFFYGYTLTAVTSRFLLFKFMDQKRGLSQEGAACLGFLMLSMAMGSYNFHYGDVWLVVPGIFTALARTLAEPAIVTIGADRVSTISRVTGTATISMFIDLGLILFAPIIGLLSQLFGGFVVAFTLLAIASLFMCVFSIAGFWRRHHVLAQQIDQPQSLSNKLRVLIVEPVHEQVVETLKNNLMYDVSYLPNASRVDVFFEVQRADILICRVATKVDREVLQYARHLKLIVSGSLGLNHIDLAEAEKRGITVLNSHYDSGGAVSELAIGLAFAALRGIAHAHVHMKEGIWNRNAYLGTELSNKKALVWGVGQIGDRLWRHLHHFGCDVMLFDPYKNFSDLPSGVISLANLDEGLQNADLIFVQIPLTSDTYQCVNRELLTKVKKGAIIVNTSRGEIVNEQDLLMALNSGQVGVYASDVWANEPQVNRVLLAHPRVVATPHIGAMTVETQKIIGEAIVRNIDCFFSRRKSQRHNLVKSFPLMLCNENSGMRCEVDVFDVSRQGLGIFTESLNVSPGDRVAIQLWEREKWATISWVEVTSQKMIRAGLVLDELFNDAEWSLLQEFAEKRSYLRQVNHNKTLILVDHPREFVLVRNGHAQGLMIETAVELEVNSEILVSINGQVQIYRVKWVNELTDIRRYLYGLELVSSNISQKRA